MSAKRLFAAIVDRLVEMAERRAALVAETDQTEHVPTGGGLEETFLESLLVQERPRKRQERQVDGESSNASDDGMRTDPVLVPPKMSHHGLGPGYWITGGMMTGSGGLIESLATAVANSAGVAA
jgi:hypothetical protein